MQDHFLKYLCLCFSLCVIDITKGQSNLVTNPSFEDIDSCYGQASSLGFDSFLWSGCTGWQNPTYASSDLWCTNPVFGNVSPPNIPGFGYQYPRTGNNMAGLFVTENIGITYREYIQNKLLYPLEANKYYEISYYVNSSDTFNYSSCIDGYISNNSVSQLTSYGSLPYLPQIKNQSDNFIIDTIGWQKVSGIYKATGGEKYITIGCFNDSTSIILSNYDSATAGGVYLFIDDISFTKLPIQLNIPNVFSPNSDGNNDVFTIDVKNIDNWRCLIYNRWGQKVFIIDETNSFWNGLNSTDGTYFYVFEGEIAEQKIRENGFLQLLR